MLSVMSDLPSLRGALGMLEAALTARLGSHDTRFARRKGAADPAESTAKRAAPSGPGAEFAALGATVAAAVSAALWRLLELLGAMYLSFRYFTGPTCWLLFGYMFWTEPVLRLPLLLYHLYIVSPAGRRAVGTSRMPWLMRRFPLYWAQASYFKGSKIVRTAALDPAGRYVFAAHPHGLLGNAYFLAFCTNQLGWDRLFPGIRVSVGVLDLNLRVSFCREICLLHGLCDVDRPTLLARLRQGPGSSVFLAVGGAAESLLTRPGCLDLVVRKRRGFVRLALEAKAALVPVIAFGENDQFRRMDLPEGSLLDCVQKLFKKATGFAMPLQDAVTGDGILGLKRGPLPLPVPLVTVVGAPLHLPPFEGDLRSPEGRAHVDACHATYLRALRELYDAHKDEYAPGRVKDMEFVE